MAPSDANGVYSLPNGYLAETGEVIQASQHNPPLEDIASSMTQRVMRSGATPMTGPLKAANGSASAPAFTFNSATGTGVYKTTNGLAVSVDGAQVAEFTASGMSKGARFIGELIPFTGTNAQSLTVLPYGQTLNRADYPDFWTFVQAEITAGNTSYNNGNGSTTFGILDMRGRAPIGWDKIGGTAANRITTAGSGIAGATLGASGGAETVTIAQTQLPNATLSVAATGSTSNGILRSTGTTACSIPLQGGFTAFPAAYSDPTTFAVSVSGSTGSLNGGVTQVATNNMPPTLICNYLLFVGA